MRVLFVDDDPMVLRALRRMLRGRTTSWEMTFTDSGEAALEAMEAEPFDVLVTDMAMPGMNGAALLERVHSCYPRAWRVVLSGHVDEVTARRVVPVSHLFVPKPCDRKTIEAVLERGQRLTHLLEADGLRSVLGEIVDLPARPTVYTELVDALEDPFSSAARLASIIEQDVALSAMILRLVNSAFFVPAKKITGVRAAVARLGSKRVKYFVLTAELFSRRFAEPPGFSLDRLFAHSLRIASLAAQLTRELRPDAEQAAEAAFLAGLLHDVGLLALLSKLPDYFAEIVDKARRTGQTIAEVEREARGTTHAEIGAYLLGMWGLPYSVIEAVAHHHTPERCVGRGIDPSTAVLLAHQLAAEAAGHDATRQPTSEEANHEEDPLDATLGALGLQQQVRAARCRSIASNVV